MDNLLGRLQWWLQGPYGAARPWTLVRVGNLISDLRFWAWSRGRGEW